MIIPKIPMGKKSPSSRVVKLMSVKVDEAECEVGAELIFYALVSMDGLIILDTGSLKEMLIAQLNYESTPT